MQPVHPEVVFVKLYANQYHHDQVLLLVAVPFQLLHPLHEYSEHSHLIILQLLFHPHQQTASYQGHKRNQLLNQYF